jgi:transposase
MWLDFCVWFGKDRKPLEFRVKNTAAGFREALRRCLEACEGAELRFLMESTGGYELDVAAFLVNSGCHVSVVNPAFVKHFIRSRGWLNKTDRVDARALAEFDVCNQPGAWSLAEPRRLEIAQLRRHRERLQEELGRLGNYLEHRAHHAEFEVRQLLASQERCLKSIDETEKRIEALVEADPILRVQVRQLVAKLKGMGVAFALALLCELGDSRGCGSAEQYAAGAGVSPCRKESGSKTGKSRISKTGNRWVRSAGWMPAGVAMIHNPPIKALAERLRAKGLTEAQIKIAAMRKLIMQAYGVLKALANETEPELLTKKPKPIRFRQTSARVRAKRESAGLETKPKLGWRTKAALKKKTNPIPKTT